MNEHTNLLEIKDLTVHYVTVDGTVGRDQRCDRVRREILYPALRERLR